MGYVLCVMRYALCITHYPLPIPVSARTDSPMRAARGSLFGVLVGSVGWVAACGIV